MRGSDMVGVGILLIGLLVALITGPILLVSAGIWAFENGHGLGFLFLVGVGMVFGGVYLIRRWGD